MEACSLVGSSVSTGGWCLPDLDLRPWGRFAVVHLERWVENAPWSATGTEPHSRHVAVAGPHAGHVQVEARFLGVAAHHRGGLLTFPALRSCAPCSPERAQRLVRRSASTRAGAEKLGARRRWAVDHSASVAAHRWCTADALALFDSPSGWRSGTPLGAVTGTASYRCPTRKQLIPRTCVYIIASSGPCPLLFAVNSTQKTLHHLNTGKRR